MPHVQQETIVSGEAGERADAGARASLAALAREEARPLAALDRGVVLTLVVGALVIVTFQSIGKTGWFNDNLAHLVEGWPREPLYPYLYWFGSSVLWLFVVPVALIAVMPGVSLSRFGLGLGDWRFGLRAAAVLYAMMLPVLVAVSFAPNFVAYYPMSAWVRGEIAMYADSGVRSGLASFLIYEAAYALYFVGWEFFHRGFLTIGLERAIGWYAVFVVAIPFGIMHVGKPFPEAYGAVAASIILGWLAVRTRSSWYGFGLHAGIAVTMDTLAVVQQVS